MFDLDAGIDWYTRFFGRPPDKRAGDDVLWEIRARHALHRAERGTRDTTAFPNAPGEPAFSSMLLSDAQSRFGAVVALYAA